MMMMEEKQTPAAFIDFQTAMDRLIPNENGVLIPIRGCSPSLFKAAIYQAIEKHPLKSRLKHDLAELQLRYAPDRWQALTLLSRHGVELPGEEGWIGGE